MNALAHCVEALYGRGPTRSPRWWRWRAFAPCTAACPRVCATPGDLGARTDALYGAYLGGRRWRRPARRCTTRPAMLGGMFGLDHGDTNAVVLGHALALQRRPSPRRWPASKALGTGDAPGAPTTWPPPVEAPASLAAMGMPAEGLDEATRRVVAEPPQRAARRSPRASADARRRATRDGVPPPSCPSLAMYPRAQMNSIGSCSRGAVLQGAAAAGIGAAHRRLR